MTDLDSSVVAGPAVDVAYGVGLFDDPKPGMLIVW